MGWNDTAPGSSPQEMVRPHRLPPGSRARTGPVFSPFETTEAPLSDSLEKQIAWVKKLLADLSLDNQILKEVSSGNF